MGYKLRLAIGLVLVLGGWPGPSRADVSMHGWYYPFPFTLDSPTSPHRFGGVEIGLSVADAGYALAFPFETALTDAKNRFIIDMELPVAIGIGTIGSTDADFYVGGPTVGMRGNWRFRFPFAGGYKLPAAVATGIELDIPLQGIWKNNNGSLLGYPAFLHDPTSWLVAFTYRPVVQFAIGKPMVFLELELALPNVITLGGQYHLLVQWGAALGSQPHELVSITLEFGGLHDTTGQLFPGDAGGLWGALGARLYLDGLQLGLAVRVPFTQAYRFTAIDGSKTEYDPLVNFVFFVGFEQRHHQPF